MRAAHASAGTVSVYPSDSGNATPLARLTVFTSHSKPLAKRFRLQEGAIQKEASADLYKGKAQTVAVATAADLRAVLDGLTTHQALAAGILQNKTSAAVLSRDAMERLRRSGGDVSSAVTRSLDYFAFPKAPGWLLWDYDDKGMPAEVAARIEALGGPVAAFFSIWPEAQAGSYLIRASSSDGVEAPGIERTRSTGLHGFFLVEDVSQSAAILQTLHKRAWAAGLGWIYVSKSGAQLSRSIVDAVVGSPERLIFEAPPILGKGLRQIRRDPILHDGAPLSAPAATDDLFSAAEAAEANAKGLTAPEAKATEARFERDLIQKTAAKSGVSLEKAAEIVRQLRFGGVLDDDHHLQIRDGSFVRVADILDNPEKWHRKALPDPIEGIDYGPDKATLFTLPRPGHPDDRPILVSHAHGQQAAYTFARYEPVITPAGAATETLRPFYPAPTESRPAATEATREAIRSGAEMALKVARPIADVRRGYEDINTFGADPDELKRERLAIRREVKAKHGLDWLPASKATTGTPRVRIMVKAPPGIGKTHAACEALKDGIGVVTAAMFPNHEKVAEFAALYDEVSADSPLSPILIQVRGRRSLDPDKADGATMCAIPDLAGQIAELGGNVREDLCSVCPHAHDCAYLRQEQKIKEAVKAPFGVILAAPHDYLTIPLPGGVVPDFTVFDEAPRNGWSVSTQITFDDLLAKPIFTGSKRPKSEIEAAGEKVDALQALLSSITPTLRALRNAIEATEGRYNDNGIMEHIRTAGVTREMVETARDEISKFNTNEAREAVEQARLETTFGRRKFENVLGKALANAKANTTRKLRTVFEALLVEFDHGRDDAVAIYGAQAWSAGRGWVPGLRVDALIRPRGNANAPLIFLDGTGDPEMVQAVFGPMDVIEHRTERNATVTFVTGQSFSQTQTAPSDQRKWPEKTLREAEALRAAIKDCRDRLTGGMPSRLAVFCNLTLRKAMGWGDDPMTGHFQNLRGSNQWERASACMVIGRPLPPPAEIEAPARAFAAATGVPFTSLEGAKMPTEQRPIRMRDGSGYAQEVPFHPDPWADRVLRQMREAEIEQAIDRLRLIRNEVPKEVFILGQVTVDVTADRVMSWADFKAGGSRIERALVAYGVIPLNRREAAQALPDIFTEDTARTDLDALAAPETLGDFPKRIFLLGKSPKLCLTSCSYRPDRKGAQIRRALVLAEKGQERARVEALLGPMKEFAVEATHWTAPAEPTLQEIEQDMREERAAILEHEAGLSREEAEIAAGLRPPEKRTRRPEPPEGVSSLVEHRQRNVLGGQLAPDKTGTGD